MPRRRVRSRYSQAVLLERCNWDIETGVARKTTTHSFSALLVAVSVGDGQCLRGGEVPRRLSRAAHQPSENEIGEVWRGGNGVRFEQRLLDEHSGALREFGIDVALWDRPPRHPFVVPARRAA